MILQRGRGGSRVGIFNASVFTPLWTRRASWFEDPLTHSRSYDRSAYPDASDRRHTPISSEGAPVQHRSQRRRRLPAGLNGSSRPLVVEIRRLARDQLGQPRPSRRSWRRCSGHPGAWAVHAPECDRLAAALERIARAAARQEMRPEQQEQPAATEEIAARLDELIDRLRTALGNKAS